MNVRTRSALAGSLVTALALPLAACGGGSGKGAGDTVEVVYNRSTDNNNRVMDDYLAKVKKGYEKANPGKKVKLVPIQAPQGDYYSKVQLMLRSPRTAPDLVYEDTFLINSDIKSGYLRPLDDYLSGWKSWSHFIGTAKAAAKAQDGKTYGVPDGTDTRGLWYNKKLLRQAGLPVPWRPKNWADILDAARTVRKKLPGVIPMHIYTGKGPGEASSMQGFEMLLYGTGDGTGLYDAGKKKWVTGSKGFKDSLTFLDTLFEEKLGPPKEDALDPNVSTTVATQWLPEGKLAIDLDGSWMGNNWIESGAKPWPKWSEVLGQAPMPTQNGQAPGRVSLSGGWTWAIPAKAGNPGQAFDFIKALQTKDNAVDYNVRSANIAVRDDVASDPAYLKSMPGIDFFTGLVGVTKYRPALPEYPQISTAVQEAMESVTTGQADPAKAQKTYDDAVRNATDGAVTSG
ncbi:extracellular solute-binding protein [Wenjunlia tyrosinilytica]|uniref:Sugar ABC transporter substrate-binding protein n=1 Tax=Wenjunlia tyrosinilytica TaxID=1544741 RepID=A0A917ZEU8_9ACTN|nr:extracellular solute-binding protein [Wenjunlia tyrosinilytica]GGO81685.1 sugar ABC transporter substrate-binding protein [Wenjunlia tyrosinilytica]